MHRLALARACAFLTAVASSSLALAQPPRAPGDPHHDAEDELAPARLDLSTPHRTLATFLAAVRDGEWDIAMQTLDLREIPADERADVAREVGRDLADVLDAEGVAPNQVADEPEPDGDRAIEVARIENVDQGIVLRRLASRGHFDWKFSAATVRAAPDLRAQLDRGPIGVIVPDALRGPRVLGLEPWQWFLLPLLLCLSVGGAIGLGRLTTTISRWLIARFGKRDLAPVRTLLGRLRQPMYVAYGLALVGLSAVLIHFPRGVMIPLSRIYLVAWSITAGVAMWMVVDFFAERIEHRAATQGDWRARRVRTRASAIRRALHVLVVFSAVVAVLFQIELVRRIGGSLVASAGVATLIIGIAAQRTLGNLIAGLQLSLTQPLRVGDEVVVEKELGTVEEITLSYVVLRLVDYRRLIVPIARLLEQPFENWTRRGTEIRGTVILPVHHATPLDHVRHEITRFVERHPCFDGVSLDVQMIDLREHTAVLRVRVSASDSERLFQLECAVREFALHLLREKDGGRYLPNAA